MGQLHYPLSENFLRYFDVAFAGTRTLKEDAYRIRYSVYCEEFQYEPGESFPNRQETDAFDQYSLHALVTHKSTGLPAGCVRLVSPAESDGSDLLPFENHCADSLDNAFVDNLAIDRTSICEISRLAVDSAFRRRAGEQITRYGEVDGLDCTQQERRTFSIIAVACFLAATALTDISRRTNVFAMMEPFLPRLLRRSGIEFQRAGADIDYHGLRAPYFITTESAVNNMRADLKELYQEIYKSVSRDFSP